MPRCYDCLTEDVTVEITDDMGFKHWFCAEDGAARQEFYEKITQMLEDSHRAWAERTAEQEVAGFKPLGLGPLLGK